MSDSPRTRLQERLSGARQDVYRPAILEAAEVLFAEQGYERARIKDIASRAGVSVGSVYGTFSGKDTLYAAVHEARTTVLLDGAERILQGKDEERDALGMILAGIDHTVRFFCAHPDYLRMHLREGTTWAQSNPATEVQATTWHQGVDVIAAAFDDGMQAGAIHRGDPALNARMVMAMLQVALASWLESRGGSTGAGPEAEEASVARVVQDVQLLVRRAFAC